MCVCDQSHQRITESSRLEQQNGEKLVGNFVDLAPFSPS